MFFQASQEFKTIHARHDQVGENQVDRIFRMDLQSLASIDAVTAWKPREATISARTSRCRASSSTTSTRVVAVLSIYSQSYLDCS